MKIKLLDLFCGAGGASMGYFRAGFDVTGIDKKPMPRYPLAEAIPPAYTYYVAEQLKMILGIGEYQNV